jgi:hypothetical protein
MQVRRQLEAAHKVSAESRAEAARLAGELAARGAEVEQLTSLSLRGDATLQDYMASLKVGHAPQLCCQYASLSFDMEMRKQAVGDRLCIIAAPHCVSAYRAYFCGHSNVLLLTYITPAVLQSLSSDVRSLQLELADARSQLEAKDDALAAAGAETANMHKVRMQRCSAQWDGSCSLECSSFAAQSTTARSASPVMRADHPRQHAVFA